MNNEERGSSDEVLLTDGSCPACGSSDIQVLITSPPMYCRVCGWRGWSGYIRPGSATPPGEFERKESR